MKKVTLILAIALMAICAVSCKNAKKVQESQIIEGEMPEDVKAELATTTAELRALGALPIVQKIGAMELSEEEKLVAPDYLYNPAAIGNLVTPFQKSNAVYVMCVDKMVAKAYGMPTDEYDAAISKLAVECNLGSVVDIIGAGSLDKAENFDKLYQTSVDELGYGATWTMASVALVEQLWFLSNNTEKYMTMFDDQAVADLTTRVDKIQDALTTASLYLPSGDILINAMTPLYTLTATTVDDFKIQLNDLKSEIASARKAILE